MNINDNNGAKWDIYVGGARTEKQKKKKTKRINSLKCPKKDFFFTKPEKQ